MELTRALLSSIPIGYSVKVVSDAWLEKRNTFNYPPPWKERPSLVEKGRNDPTQRKWKERIVLVTCVVSHPIHNVHSIAAA